MGIGPNAAILPLRASTTMEPASITLGKLRLSLVASQRSIHLLNKPHHTRGRGGPWSLTRYPYYPSVTSSSLPLTLAELDRIPFYSVGPAQLVEFEWHFGLQHPVPLRRDHFDHYYSQLDSRHLQVWD